MTMILTFKMVIFNDIRFKTKELIFHINDKNCGIAYDNIDVGQDIKYKMAIDHERCMVMTQTTQDALPKLSFKDTPLFRHYNTFL